MERKKRYKLPRLVMSGLSGGSGKTVATLGLAMLWQRKGLVVAPFKKGPDYIDAAWQGLSAHRPAHNLDTFLMEPADILRSLEAHGRDADVALIEGNRGLYDGMDAEGTQSTAELAKLLKAPVILVINCTKVTRTVAALVLGCTMMDERLAIKGVILNEVATARQESVIRRAVEKVTAVPVLGSIPRIRDFSLSERHLGLLPPQEHPEKQGALERISEATRNNLDSEGLLKIATAAPPLTLPAPVSSEPAATLSYAPRIGVFRDSAFTFYYPENLEALERCGAILIEISGLRDRELPPVDALYIGGGFPETHAKELSGNRSFLASVKRSADEGLPIYAECGGLIFLSEAVEYCGELHAMAGVFPVTFSVGERPQGHGYMIVEIDTPTPFFKSGTLRGHEFHYARVLRYTKGEVETAFSVKRGHGFDCGRDGLVYRNTLATFCHIHALGEKQWARIFVEAAARHARGCR